MGREINFYPPNFPRNPRDQLSLAEPPLLICGGGPFPPLLYTAIARRKGFFAPPAESRVLE